MQDSQIVEQLCAFGLQLSTLGVLINVFMELANHFNSFSNGSFALTKVIQLSTQTDSRVEVGEGIFCSIVLLSFDRCYNRS